MYFVCEFTHNGQFLVFYQWSQTKTWDTAKNAGKEREANKSVRNDTNSYKSKGTFNLIFTADHVLFTLERLSYAFEVLICFWLESEKAIESDLKTLNNHKLSNE